MGRLGARRALVAVGIAIAGVAAGSSGGTQPAMVRVPAGSYLPLYAAPPPDSAPSAALRAPRRRPVVAFTMDIRPVTNAEFLAFVREHPQWRRSRVAPLFADGSYLRHWRSDLELGDLAPPDGPVVNVSWFAARAYLKARGKALPTVDQWEYAAAASETKADASRDSAFLARLRAWYARPTADRVPNVGSTFRNAYGIDDLHGLVWEWTLDFNSALVSGESRADGSVDRTLYCGGGAASASDFEDYAAFMRYAFRSSLQANYCVANLGFRGVMTDREPTP